MYFCQNSKKERRKKIQILLYQHLGVMNIW